MHLPAQEEIMPASARQKVDYKQIVGSMAEVQQELTVLKGQNWTPILMSASETQDGPVAITILLEHRTQEAT
jgi:hypothetical protein